MIRSTIDESHTDCGSSSIERYCIKHTFYLENCGDREVAISEIQTHSQKKDNH